MTPELLATLNPAPDHTSEYLAELSIDEMTAFEGVDEALAHQLIMAARAPWFA